MANDIHAYDHQLEMLVSRIKTSELSEENKKLLLDYDRSMLLVEGLGKPRRLRLLSLIFLTTTTYFRKELRTVTVDDIKDCLRAIEDRKVSPWTVSLYKVSIKKFFRWLTYGDMVSQTTEVPPLVSWIKIHVKKKNQPRVQASAILTEDEVHRLIAAAQLPRDRAFVSMLYELGARIGEIGGLRIGDISRDDYTFLIDISGKTGHRTPRIVMSDPYLAEWLNHHPLKNDPSAPLWPCVDRRGGFKPMDYGAFHALVLRLKQKADITKRLYPHLFRHTRVTHVLAKRLMNEAQAKVYFGWTPDSKMLSDYAHLVSQDVNEAILEMHGIKMAKNSEKEIARTCPRCHRINTPEAKFCVQCSFILDPTVAFQQGLQRSRTDQLLTTLLEDKRIQQLVLEKLMELDRAKLQELLGDAKGDTSGLQGI